MRSFADALRATLVVLWIGGLWTAGLIVAPILFHQLDGDHALAGTLAGLVFRANAWVGMFAGGYIALHLLACTGVRALRELDWWLIIAMLALTLLNHFAIFPILADLRAHMQTVATGLFGGGFASWHAISGLLYLLQMLLGLAFVVRGAANK